MRSRFESPSIVLGRRKLIRNNHQTTETVFPNALMGLNKRHRVAKQNHSLSGLFVPYVRRGGVSHV